MGLIYNEIVNDMKILNVKLIKQELNVIEYLTKETFLEKIADYENSNTWEYKGELPGIIDFYADWCAPCKMMEPIIEEFSKEYEGKINLL